MKLNNFILFPLVLLLSFFSSCEQDVTTSPPKTLPANTGILFVDSKPQGARIFLNGEFTGHSTPDTVRWYEEGNYILTCKMKLFKDTNIVISVKQNETTAVFLDYTKNPSMYGSLYCTSYPSNSLIILNDSITNKRTPAKLDNLIPGYHDLKFKLTGYWDGQITALVNSAVTNYTRTCILIDTSLWIHYTTKNSAIPLDYLNCVAIERGYIKWIGTKGSGLVRFDDKEWRIFNTENSGIADDYITTIAIDKQNRKWIGTLGGVSVFDDDAWINFNTQNSGLTQDYITAINIDPRNGEAWIGTLWKGLFSFNGSSWRLYDTSNTNIPSNNITSIKISDEGVKWIGLADPNAIIKFSTLRFMGVVSRLYNRSLIYSVPSDITIDKNNIVWFSIGRLNFKSAGSGCAYYFNNKLTVLQTIPSRSVSSVAVDKFNNKWFGNFHDGLAKFDGHNWTYYTTGFQKLQTNMIMDVSIDSHGNKWLATFDKGLAKYKGN